MRPLDDTNIIQMPGWAYRWQNQNAVSMIAQAVTCRMLEWGRGWTARQAFVFKQGLLAFPEYLADSMPTATGGKGAKSRDSPESY